MNAITTFAVFLSVTVMVASDPVRMEEDSTYLTRVVGGEPVKPGDIPWQVSLQDFPYLSSPEMSHFCGGTLIAPSWVVTAAHCFYGRDVREVAVVVGAWNLTDDNTEYRIERNYTHHHYNLHTMENDITLLKLDLKNPLKLSTGTGRKGKPIRLQKKKDVVIKKKHACIISGWGLLSWDGQSPEVLHAAKISLQSDRECAETMANAEEPAIFKPTNFNVCGGGSGADTCQKDSGGPLVCCKDAYSPDSSCRLFGITSWGASCGTIGLPGIYTEVAYYTEWIANIMKEDKQTEIAEA